MMHNFLMALKAAGRLFYIVSPNETSFETVYEVPDYVKAVQSDIVGLFLLEICISMLLRKSNIRVNDTIATLSQGIIIDLINLLAPGGRLAVYMYIHSNWRLVDLPWNYPSTWWICFLGIDFAFYWVHRSAHAFNFLWASHIVHHNSEDYNMTITTRQSILQIFTSWILYLPAAFIVPPQQFLVHSQFAYIYQFWIHTTLIPSLGPLEYILNTPSHHRVHHGANKNYIHKNFAQTLIIWDRLFGTFEAEKEEIVYGLTHPIGTFGIVQIQFHHCVDMWRKFREYKGWKNKLSVFIKGPGWSPEKPCLGNSEDIPNRKAPAKKYNPYLPSWLKIYVIWHFLLVIQGYKTIMDNYSIFPRVVLYGSFIFQVFSLISIGMFLDKSDKAPSFELKRCTLYFMIECYFYTYTRFSLTSLHARWFSDMYVQATYIVSFFFWMWYTLHPTDYFFLSKGKTKAM